MINIEHYIEELLHINEPGTNKLIDLYASGGKNLYLLYSNDNQMFFSQSLLADIAEIYGSKGSVLLRNSALNVEQIIGLKNRIVDWKAAVGINSVYDLDKFITDAFSEIKNKGNNPLFLSVGAIKWKYAMSTDEVKDVVSPLIIFPIRLNRISGTSPVHVEFVEDEVYINPCLVSALAHTLDESIIKNFPHPNGTGLDLDIPVDLEKLQDGKIYFDRVSEFFNKIHEESQGQIVFEFLEDNCAISSYNHNEICMYYDIRRNKDKILSHNLVNKAFSVSVGKIDDVVLEKQFKSTQPFDTIQENIIKRAVNGESMVIKGPPGTGKTLTISNMIGSLLAEDKKILLVSKKLAALSEVYAKVDPVLRKFILLLESESEAQAANINSNEILTDLRELLNSCKNYKYDGKNANDINNAKLAISNNTMELDKYYRLLFDKNYLKEIIKEINDPTINGLYLELPESYYDILDTYYRHPEMPNISFITPTLSLQFRKEAYSKMFADVSDANTYYNLLTYDRTIKLHQNPWYGCLNFETDNFSKMESRLESDKIFSNFGKIKDSLDIVISKVEEAFKGINISNLMLKTIYWLIECYLTEEQIKAILDVEDSKKFKEDIYKLICSIEYLNKKVSVNNYKNSIEEIENYYPTVTKLLVDKELTYEQFKLIEENLELFGHGEIKLDRLVVENIINVMSLVEKNDAEIEKKNRLAYAIFKKDLSNKDIKTIQKFYELASKKEELKLSLFDFSLKSLFKKVSTMSFLETVSLDEAFSSAQALFERETYLEKNKSYVREISKLFQRELSKEEVSLIKLVCSRSAKEEVSLDEYINRLCNSSEAIRQAYEMLNVKSDIKLGEIIQHFELASLLGVSKRTLKANNIPYQDNTNIFDLIKSTYVIMILKEEMNSKEIIPQAFAPIFEALHEKKDIIRTNLRNAFKAVLEISDHFHDNIYLNNEEVTIGEMKFFISNCIDKEILSNYINYNKIKNSLYEVRNESVSALNDFFTLIEVNDDINDYPLQLIFEHSYYQAMIKMVGLLLPNDMQNNIGNFNELKLNNCLEGYSSLEKANVLDIERTIMASIDPTDPIFGPFLNINRTKMTLRMLFKRYAEAILKLKKAILISPSTVSLLFREEEFEKFDVVIIDEASQMTPVSLLPILFRTKQMIVVGDEYQMPPIKHFVKKMVDTNNYVDVDEVMLPSDSALNLVLKSNSFRSYHLLCHYRSQTETLIKYSNERHYENMRTFPAPIPKANGLGFRDIYIEGATGGGGRNKLEAIKCVELIKEHFDKFYDVKDKVLKESIGIVAFGTNQIDEIEEVLKKPENKELKEKIDYARKNEPSGIKDKAYFLKTIETVQGQEADHVILSFTYGVTESGKLSSSFGQLSQANIGECIFNVAVSRAKKSITVIHSIKAIDIKQGLNAAFITEYLKISERYSESIENSFEGVKPQLGFIADVKNYIISLGISEDRVVCDYGTNKGSVRIPIAILSKDKTHALCGIWTEKPPLRGYTYIDYNGRYFNVLKNYGWNFYKLFIHDWYVNNDAEKDKLKNYILKFNK